MRLIALCLTLLACTCPSHAQEALKRQATVTTADDKKYEGMFIKADASGVTLETDNAQTTVKLETVKSIVFGDTPQEAPAVDAAAQQGKESDEAAQRAVGALRKLNSATSVGVTYLEYGRILIDAKTGVDAELATIQEGHLKNELRFALREYTLAAQIWHYFVQNPRKDIPSKSDLGRLLINSYGVPVKISVFTGITRNGALSAVWAKANQHFRNAETAVAK